MSISIAITCFRWAWISHSKISDESILFANHFHYHPHSRAFLFDGFLFCLTGTFIGTYNKKFQLTSDGDNIYFYFKKISREVLR